MSSNSGKRAPTTATQRLKQDYLRIKKDPVPYICAEPLPSNILEWHYVVRGPEMTPYEGGYYHGKLIFPREFPFKPPSIYMITPNGRFKCNTRLCLSITDFHPDTWNPAWSVSTILTGLLSFMVEKGPTLGSIETSDFTKRQLAAQSLVFNLKDKVFCELFPEVVELPEASGPEFTDAHVTWLNFVRRPDHGPSKKRCRGQDKKLRGLSGPPGHPGVEVPQESALREFQDMLKEATEHRSLGLLGPVLPEGIGRQLVAEAFHCRLRGPVLVDKKTLVELQGFQAVSGHGGGPHRTAGHSGPGATLGLHTAPRLGPAAQGAFLRGSGLSLASGRFTAPVTAIFQFSASLHVDPRELQGRVRPRARDTVRVLVCIESLCHRYMSLEAISSLESSGSVFSMHVQGLLQLQAGQYTSVFVDNGSGAALTVQSSSSFSGLLLGP